MMSLGPRRTRIPHADKIDEMLQQVHNPWSCIRFQMMIILHRHKTDE